MGLYREIFIGQTDNDCLDMVLHINNEDARDTPTFPADLDIDNDFTTLNKTCITIAISNIIYFISF